MQKLFISYSRRDMDFARKLAGDLEKAGYDVWWDISDLKGGDDWVRVIPAAIESSQFVLVVLSPNSITSEWVQKEYTQALNLHKKIIPIMLETTGVPFALNTINFVNFSTGKYEDNYKTLLSALGYSGEPPAVTTFITSRLSQFPVLGKYAIPIGIVVLVLLLLITYRATRPPVPVSPTITPTNTFEPASATPSATPTDAPTFTSTVTPSATPTKPTSTSTSTSQLFQSLRLCLNVAADVNNINVRSGPGTTYAPLGEPLDVDSCLRFSANNEEATWLQVASLQSDPALQQYAGGWIRRDLFGLTGSIDLPVVTLTPTSTRTATSTTTPTLTQTPLPTPSNTPTVTPTATETDTPVPTETPTP